MSDFVYDPYGNCYTPKTQPLQFEEFKPCLEWWNSREENGRAWKVPAAELFANGCNLDRKNPHGKVDFEHLPPEQLADDILKKEQRIAELMAEIKALLREGT
jgi:type I restriction enzyme M protein